MKPPCSLALAYWKRGDTASVRRHNRVASISWNLVAIVRSGIVPNAWPVIIAVAIFHLVYSWNLYFEPLLYLSTVPELQPISLGLSKFNSIYGSEPQYIQAATLMTIAIPLVVFIFAQRAFMRGIVITGVEK